MSTKSEIEEMPKGLSSEELDAMTTDESVDDNTDLGSEKAKNLAEEALDATESPPAEEPAEEKEEPAKESTEEIEPELTEDEKQLKAKDSKIASLKHEKQEIAIEKAKLEGRLEAQAEMRQKVEEPEKSPLEIAEEAYIKEFGELPEGGLPMTGKLYREQATFDSKQTAAKTAVKTKEQTDSALVQAAETLQEGDFSAEKKGKGLDWKSVAKIGDKYLTAGDELDLQNIQNKRGNAAVLKEAYKIMVRRILIANNEDSEALKAAITKSQTKPKKKKTDIDALITEGEEKGEAETETHNTKIVDFIFAP